jgi:hypothetical protein
MRLIIYNSWGSSKLHLEMQIEQYTPQHLDAIVRLSLRAWTPVFESIQNAMDADVYQVWIPRATRGKICTKSQLPKSSTTQTA